jgi:hypothetical protein
MILDYCSFAAFAHDLWCFDQQICVDTDGVYLKYQLLAWRDLISSVLCVCNSPCTIPSYPTHNDHC